MSNIYVVTFAISIVYLVLLLVLYKKHISAYYVLMCGATVVDCLGYWQVSNANSVETAIAANRMVYLSVSFIMYFMLHCIADLCHIKMPRWVSGICLCISGFVFGCAMTVGKSDLYYQNVRITKSHGVTVLLKDYGPLHIIYPIYILILVLYGIGMVVYAMRFKKEISVFSCVLSLAIMGVNTGIYVAERIIHSDIEWMALAYVISFGIILIQLQWVKMYDIEGFSSDEIIHNNQLGFILLNGNGRFEGADEFARKYFPELNQLRVDRQIKHTADTELFQIIRRWLKESGGEKYQFLCGDTYIEASHTRFNESFEKDIHCIRLRNNSQEKNYQKLIESYNNELEQKVEEKTNKIMRVQDDIIISMASIVENRDSDTGGHIARTSATVKVFVEHLLKKRELEGLTDEIAIKIIKAAPLHDFGKIAIPDKILNKPGKFTETEFEKMKEHSVKGATIVSRILQNSDDFEFRNLAVNMAHYHHEKWNGTGYPEGLKAQEIPVEARIMALADVFDALVSKRVYKEQFSFEKAFEIIEESSGSHFDPVLCRDFLECRNRLEETYEQME